MKDRKLKELQRFQQVMVENDENQRRLKDEADRERIEVLPPPRRTSGPRKNTPAFRTSWNASASRRRRNARRRSRQ
jgi:hypothetical protein